MNSLFLTVLNLLCFIVALTFHEAAHAFVASKLGDPTAKNMGRRTLNPLKHIDPFGTVVLPLALAIMGMPAFGYAKPVPYNPRYFKNIRVGEVLTGLAGPAMNLILAVVSAMIGAIAKSVAWSASSQNMEVFGWVCGWIYYISYFFTYINLALAFFNIIPIPPLDGSSVIAAFLPDRALRKYYSIQRYALPVFMIVLIVMPMLIGVNLISVYLSSTAQMLTWALFGML